MKKFLSIIPLCIFLFAACDSDDDGFYNAVYIQSANLVTIENPANAYSVNEPVFVSAQVPRLLAEPGKGELLDLRETTGGAQTFDFSFFAEKKGADGQWVFYPLTADNYVDGGKGSHQVDQLAVGTLDYDGVGDTYEFRGGIRFTEPGQYRLNFTNSTKYPAAVFLRSLSTGNNIVVNLFSFSEQLASGYWTFNVN